jgi:hypothetical protein
MTEEQLQSMSEQEIRARFRCAPAYYLQAKLEKKWALDGRKDQAFDQVCEDSQARITADAYEPAVADMADCWDPSVAEPWQQAARRRPAKAARRQPASLDVASGEGVTLDLPLPGFEILDAALSETDDVGAIFAQAMDEDVDAAELTQQAILEAALEDYSNWPLSSVADARQVGELAADGNLALEVELTAQPEPEAESDLERKLKLVLNSEPELKLVLDAEPELEVVLHSEPELEQALDAETGFLSDNVTLANFGNRAPRTVPVVSVVMDRKRPNMVRVVGMSTRLAS